MKLYRAKVRLHGSPLDEVQKINLTAAEIRILKHVHGDDAVVDTKEQGNGEEHTEGVILQSSVDRAADVERDRLEQVYGEKTVSEVFGAPVARIEDDVSGRPLDADLPVVRRTQPPNAITTTELEKMM